MYRIMVVHLEVPPLRDRREDIRPLIAHLTAQHAVAALDRRRGAREERYHWPGNVRELQNVIEQLAWLHGHSIGVKDLPPTLSSPASGALRLGRERRKRVCRSPVRRSPRRSCSFWEHIYPMFINRDITRADIMTASGRQGTASTSGNYRAVLQVLGMPPGDYKRFLNFLSTHGCNVDFREFRSGRGLARAPIGRHSTVHRSPTFVDGRWTGETHRARR